MFTGEAPPSPPWPPKMVPKNLLAPPRPTVRDPLTPETMVMLLACCCGFVVIFIPLRACAPSTTMVVEEKGTEIRLYQKAGLCRA